MSLKSMYKIKHIKPKLIHTNVKPIFLFIFISWKIFSFTKNVCILHWCHALDLFLNGMYFFLNTTDWNLLIHVHYTKTWLYYMFITDLYSFGTNHNRYLCLTLFVNNKRSMCNNSSIFYFTLIQIKYIWILQFDEWVRFERILIIF